MIRRFYAFAVLLCMTTASLFACHGDEGRLSALERDVASLKASSAVVLEKQAITVAQFENIDRELNALQEMNTLGPVGASGGYVFAGGEQRFGLYARLREDTKDWQAGIPASTWTTVYALPTLAADQLSVVAALAIVQYDNADASVSCAGGVCDAVIRRYVPGRLHGTDFCRPDGVCASAGSFDVGEDSYVPPSGIMAGTQARITLAGGTLALQVNCASTCRATGGISAQSMLASSGAGGGDAGTIDSGSDSGSDSGTDSGGGGSQTIASLTMANAPASAQPTAGGPMAGGLSLTVNGSNLTSCSICGIALSSITGSGASITGTTPSFTGCNAGAAKLADVTCGSATLSASYLVLPSTAQTFLRADQVTTVSTAISSAYNFVSGNNTDWVQATSANRPSLDSSNATLGRPAFWFNYTNGGAGVDQYLTGPSMSSWTSGEKMAVEVLNQANNQGDIFGTSGTPGYDGFGGAVYDDFGSNARYTGTAQPATATTAYVTVKAQAGSWSYVGNGTTYATSGTNTVGFPTSGTFGSAKAAYATNREVGEILLMNGIASAGDVTAMSGYQTARYAGGGGADAGTDSGTDSGVDSGGGSGGTVASITPGAGPLAGGQSVTIAGAGLSGPSCTIDGVAATGCSGTSTSITCTTGSATGANSGNAVWGSVVCNGGTLTNAYLYLPSTTKAFLRADAVTLGTGSNIASATDLSGNAAWTQATSANQPTLHATSSINSQPTFLFNYANTGAAVNQSLSGPSLSSMTQGSMYEIEYLNQANNQGDLLGTGGTGEYDGLSGIVYNDFGSNARYTCTSQPTVSTPTVVYVTATAGTWVYKINGTNVAPANTNVVGFTATPKFGSNGASFASNREVAELGIFTAPLGAGDLATMVAYHTAHYGQAY